MRYHLHAVIDCEGERNPTVAEVTEALSGLPGVDAVSDVTVSDDPRNLETQGPGALEGLGVGHRPPDPPIQVRYSPPPPTAFR